MTPSTLPSPPRPAPSPGRAEAARRPGRPLDALLPAALLLLAAALRLPGLFRFPFEQDELYTAIEARFLFDSPLNPGIEARPLYYLLQHPLLELWPVAHLPLRLLPFLFGMLGVAATWVLARRLFGTGGAAVASLLVAVSPWHLHASGMARYWSLVYLLSALFLLFAHLAYADDRPRHHLMALAALLLGTLTHPTFVFPCVGVAAGLTLVRADGGLGWRWPSRRAWAFLWVPFLVACAAGWLALSLTGREGAVQNWSGRDWLGSLRLVPAIVEWMTPTVFAAGGLGALVLLTAVGPARRRWGATALLGTVSALLLLCAASLRTSVYADYAISALPLVFVSAGGLVAVGAERMRSGGRAAAAVSALVLLAGVLPASVSYLSDGNRFDYRPAFQEIAARDPGVTVLSMPIVLQRHYAPELRGRELQMTRAFLDAELAREGDLWVVLPVRREGVWQDALGEVAAWTEERCRLVASHQRPRLDFRLYRVDLLRCR